VATGLATLAAAGL
jgi:hypothetical protein